MIPTYREDFLEEDELHDDFNSYGLPMRPRIHRGVARPHYPKQRKRRLYRGGIAPPLRPKRRRPIKVAKNILLPRKKAIKFGEPRGGILKKSPVLKVTPPIKPPKSTKKITSDQKTSERTSTKVKALRKEIAQNENARTTTKQNSSKAIIIVLVITTTVLTGYVVWQARKKNIKP